MSVDEQLTKFAVVGTHAVDAQIAAALLNAGWIFSVSYSDSIVGRIRFWNLRFKVKHRSDDKAIMVMAYLLKHRVGAQEIAALQIATGIRITQRDQARRLILFERAAALPLVHLFANQASSSNERMKDAYWIQASLPFAMGESLNETLIRESIDAVVGSATVLAENFPDDVELIEPPPPSADSP